MQSKKVLRNIVKTIIMGKAICYFLLLTPIEVYGSWQDWREGKKTITYDEILDNVPKKDIERRSLCAAMVQLVCEMEKGKHSTIEKGIYGSASDMYGRTKKYSLNIDSSKKEGLCNYLKAELKEGDLIFAKHPESGYPLHVALYLGENKVKQQFTDPVNKKEKPRVEIISLEDFLKTFEFKDAIRSFP